MTVPWHVLQLDKGLSEWCILHAWRGSVAHGTYVPSSDPRSIDDKDTMAVCVPDVGHYLGLRTYASRGTRELKRDEWDVVIYEARKTVDLLRKGNPNVLALLWLPENLYISRTDAGRALVEAREVFSGRHVYHSFVGYARGQAVKMERSEFRGYMGEKRKRLVEQHGYDTKNAAHLIRLLRQGIEFLATGELQVVRPDASELVAIKNGEWSLERVKAEAEHLFGWAYKALVHSTLPTEPDRGAVEHVCQHVVRTELHCRGEL